jgi:hypothetical protein
MAGPIVKIDVSEMEITRKGPGAAFLQATERF